MRKPPLKALLLLTVVICIGLFILFTKFNYDKILHLWNVKASSTGESITSCNILKDENRIESSVSQAYIQDKTKSLKIKEEMAMLNKRKVAADDPRLVALIRDYYLVPPSNIPYHLDKPDSLDNSRGQAPIMDNKLKYKENGFYVESGAYDGETLSNTLMLERMRNWNGLLVEPNPDVFTKLRKKNRKAYAINACLSTEAYPKKKMIIGSSLQAKVISQKSSKKRKQRKTTKLVQCFPLYSILLALNQTTIDYLSLDVEGEEKGVLGTIPWQKVQIEMMSVEYDKWQGGARQLCKYMYTKGYDCLVTLSGNFVADVILKKKTIQKRKRTTVVKNKSMKSYRTGS